MFAEILKKHDTLITTYHEHDSLLENKEEEELNEDERKAAWEDYENEKKGTANQGAAFNLGGNSFEIILHFFALIFCLENDLQYLLKISTHTTVLLFRATAN